jgi:hypothetical protein
MATPLSRSRKNELYGLPGTQAMTNVSSRLPWTPRNTAGKVQVVLAHPLIADEFVAACDDAARVCPGWAPGRIDSLSVRAVRGKEEGWTPGGPNTSNHSWGLAFDFFATAAGVSPPGGVWTPHNGVPEEFARAFEARGWVWGGRWTQRTDTPHIEFTQPPRAGLAAVAQSADVDWLTLMLKQGDFGSEVEQLQGALNMVVNAICPVTGIFDPVTKSAVEQVQTITRVKVDGIVGPATEAAIAGLLAAVDPPELVARAYRGALGREADPDGHGYWIARINGGHPPMAMWRHLRSSDERLRPPAAPPPPPPPPSGPITDDEIRSALIDVGSRLLDLGGRS